MCACTTCGFVWNRTFDPKKLSYGPGYDNTQDCSPYFAEYVDDLVRHLVVEKSVKRARVVEIGCGKGSFLRRIVLFSGAENTGVGFDPSYLGPSEDLDGRLRFHREYYSPSVAGLQADVVVSRHVIEHVADPLGFLATLRTALEPSPRARAFIETPCVEWILRNFVFWDFFYEHCSLFNRESLAAAGVLAGFRANEVGHVFSGQYLWAELSLADSTSRKPDPDATVAAMAESFAGAERAMREQWKDRLENLSHRGRIAVWGAGAKGTTFVNLLDPGREFVEVLVDLNPKKQGRFTPGTGHPIVGIDGLRERGIRQAILMNPNYRDENHRLLQHAGLAVELVS